MLQLRAKAISTLRAHHSQLSPQPGPSSIQDAKDHPSWNKGRHSFSTTGTLGLGLLRGNISPPILGQAGSGTSQRAESLCLQGEAKKLRQQLHEAFGGANVIFKLEIFILMKKLWFVTLSTIVSFVSFSQSLCNCKRKSEVRGWAEPWPRYHPLF